LNITVITERKYFWNIKIKGKVVELIMIIVTKVVIGEAFAQVID
jgi:hypothetical protein